MLHFFPIRIIESWEGKKKMPILIFKLINKVNNIYKVGSKYIKFSLQITSSILNSRWSLCIYEVKIK